METLKERLLKFIKYQDVTVAAFERKCGLSTSYIANIQTSIQPDKALRISQAYPELNFDWLLLGRGSMILENSSDSNEKNDDSTKFRNIINNELVNALKDHISTLKSENQGLRKEIEELKREKSIASDYSGFMAAEEITYDPKGGR